MSKIKTSVRQVVEGVNKITVPEGSNICGFIASGHGLGVVVGHAEHLPDEVSYITVTVLKVGSRALEIDDTVKYMHIGTLCDYEDSIYSAYGYETKGEEADETLKTPTLGDIK